MGGMGSGNWCRWNKKTTTEEVHSVDIRYMRNQGLLKPNSSGTLSWSCRGEQTGWIRYQAHDSYLRLIYRSRSNGEEWQSMDERIYFQRAPCHYGGERLWFSCPHCHTRVAIVYAHGARFLCRHCCDLPYASQREGYLDRMIRKARKIRQRLDADMNLDFPIFDKPKGMHWKTFNKLKQKERIANQGFSRIFEIKLEMLQKYELR